MTGSNYAPLALKSSHGHNRFMPTPPRPNTARPAAGGRKKTPQEILLEARNAAAVAVVQSGFDALDELAEIGKNHLKRALIRGISGK